jgi:type II secretory pathway pseudopilin PulG
MIQTQRPAFSMITAMVVIVIMSSITAMVMGTSSKIIQNTTAQYQREQAMLWAKSYTELAIMTVMSNDRINQNCISTITGDIDNPNLGQGYHIRCQISFIGTSNQVNTCPANTVLSNAVTTTASALNIIVDTYVEYKDINHPDIANSPWITYHKRTLQKI